jgi:hypothetical protein
VQVSRLLRPRHGAVEVAALAVLYGIYELTRGTVDGSWALAQAHAAEIVRLPWKPAVVWFQLGIRHDGAAERLAREGIEVVQDRCLMVEVRRIR